MLKARSVTVSIKDGQYQLTDEGKLTIIITVYNSIQ